MILRRKFLKLSSNSVTWVSVIDLVACAENHKNQTQSTFFPQSEFPMCITCEEQFFFLRKANAHSNIFPVEKNSAETRLICLVIA
jgi:hypothetical protein